MNQSLKLERLQKNLPAEIWTLDLEGGKAILKDHTGSVIQEMNGQQALNLIEMQDFYKGLSSFVAPRITLKIKVITKRYEYGNVVETETKEFRISPEARKAILQFVGTHSNVIQDFNDKIKNASILALIIFLGGLALLFLKMIPLPIFAPIVGVSMVAYLGPASKMRRKKNEFLEAMPEYAERKLILEMDQVEQLYIWNTYKFWEKEFSSFDEVYKKIQEGDKHKRITPEETKAVVAEGERRKWRILPKVIRPENEVK